MNYLGSQTPEGVVKKFITDLLSMGFEAGSPSGVITLSADLATGDTVTVFVNGEQTSVAYATSHAATITAIATAVAALPTVDSAVGNGRTITITPALAWPGESGQITPKERLTAIFAQVAHSAAGTAIASVALTENTLTQGMPVKLDSTAKLVPLAAGEPSYKCIGFLRLYDAHENRGTVITNRNALINTVSSVDNMVPGPVKYDGLTVDGKIKVSNVSVDHTNVYGYAISTGNTNSVIEVLI